MINAGRFELPEGRNFMSERIKGRDGQKRVIELPEGRGIVVYSRRFKDRNGHCFYARARRYIRTEKVVFWEKLSSLGKF